MRLFALVFTVALFPVMLHAQDAEVVRLSQPVLSTPMYQEFGSLMGDVPQFYHINEAIDQLPTFEGKEFVLAGEVSKGCQVKGCWMILSEGDRNVRVRFKDYEFFVPSDITGRRVEVRGMLTEVELSEEEAKHFAEDAADGAGEHISGPQREYNFTASSVRVYQ